MMPAGRRAEAPRGLRGTDREGVTDGAAAPPEQPSGTVARAVLTHDRLRLDLHLVALADQPGLDQRVGRPDRAEVPPVRAGGLLPACRIAHVDPGPHHV